MDADHHVSCDKELRWNVNVEPLFVQDQGVDTGSRKTGRKYKSFIKTMDARAWNTLKAAKGAKKALRTPEGQQSMKGDDENGEPQNVF